MSAAALPVADKLAAIVGLVIVNGFFVLRFETFCVSSVGDAGPARGEQAT